MSDLRRDIEYSVNSSSIQKAVQSLQKISKEEQDLAKQIMSATQATLAHEKALGKTEKEQRQVAVASARLSKEIQEQGKQAQQATRALEDYERSIQAVKKSGADFGGDTASFTSGLRGGLDALTGGNTGALGTGLEKIQGIAEIREALPQLLVQFDSLGNVMRATSGVTGTAVTGIGNMIAGVTGLSAGVSSFAVVALPVVATLGALVYAYQEYNKAAEGQRSVLAALSESLIDTNRRIAEGLTSDEIAAEIARIETLREADLKSLETFNQRYSDLVSSIPQELENTIFQPVAGLIEGWVRLTSGTEQDLVNTIQELEQGTIEYNAQLTILEQAQNDVTVAANNAAAAEEKLAQERENFTRQAEQSLARAQQIQAQYADIVENNAIAANNAAEIEAVQSAIDNQNEQIAERKHQDALAKIRTDGQARIEAITAELDSLSGERIAELAKVQTAGNEKLKTLQDEYQKSTIQKYEDFSKRLDKSTTDAAKSIARLARDIKDTLTDATLENDVAAFLKAQRDGEKRLKDTRQDAQQQQKEMVDDFLLAQERERQAYMAKQEAIKQAISDEQRQVMTAYAERRQALEDQRKQEQQAIVDRINAERQRHAEQIEQASIRAQQMAQLDAVREKQQQEAYNRQLDRIQQLEAAEVSKYQLELNKIREVSSAIASIPIPSGNSLSFGGSGQTPISKGTRNNPRGNTNLFSTTINSNTTVGDVASSKEVENAMNENNRVLLGAITKTIKGASGRRRPA